MSSCVCGWWFFFWRGGACFGGGVLVGDLSRYMAVSIMTLVLVQELVQLGLESILTALFDVLLDEFFGRDA